MKRKIMIFVTILFVALALNGFAHNRHKEFKKEHQKCVCEKQHRPIDKNTFDGRKPENRPSKDFKHEGQRKGRHEQKEVTMEVKDTINGKIAMVSVGAPLTQFEIAHLQLLN